MAGKKRKAPQVERPTFFGCIKEHPMKVIRGGVKGAAFGTAVGGGVSLAFGTPMIASAAIGGGAGLLAGSTDAALDAVDLEATIHERGEQMMDTLDERLELAEERLTKAGESSTVKELRALRREVSGLFKPSKPQKDEDDEDEKKLTPRKGAREGARA